MSENVRALILVLALAVPAFYLVARTMVSLIEHREFAVWRNSWLAVTIAAFLSGSFFVFAPIVAIVVCLYVRSVRAVTVALFLVLLFAVPLVEVWIQGFGIPLFPFNNGRLLAIILLLPILFRTGGLGHRKRDAYAIPDWLIAGHVLLLIALQFQVSEPTNVMRVAMMHTLDVLVPYFAFSRAVTSMADFRRVLLAFIIAVVPLSVISVFEVAKHWLLYGSIFADWGGRLGYVQRESILRAAASSAGPISLGFIVMVAIGCVLASWQRTNQSRRFAKVALTMLAAGLIASLSRGPWVGTAVLVLAYLATGPNPIANLGKLAVVLAVTTVPLLLTPVGERLLDFLPFIGSVDEQTVAYRQRLLENALAVIVQNPLLGSVNYLSTPEMQQMIQGEGIIDMVNTYLVVALYSGLVGLGLYLGFFATILIGLWRVRKFRVENDLEFNSCVRASMATLLAILVTIGTVSSTDFIPYAIWCFAGLSVALVRIAYTQRAAVAREGYGTRKTAVVTRAS